MRNELPWLYVIIISCFKPSNRRLYISVVPDSSVILVSFRITFSIGAGVPLTTAQLYGGAHTDDLRSTLLYLRDKYPEAPLLGIGFSLGANVLTRYVEEEGDRCRLRSACVLGCVS
jgi:predicted alpha/beta-fold hydrolase